MTTYTSIRSLVRAVFGSPDHDRLAGAIAETWIELDHQIRRDGHGTLTEDWARTAHQQLLRAEGRLRDWNIQEGWAALLSAQRAMLFNPHEPSKLERVAIVLKREADKVTGWRAKAIEDLICGEGGELRPTLQSEPNRVIDALALRDDQFHTLYFKILLRRRHLSQLFMVLWIGVAICLVLSYLGQLPAPFDKPNLVAAVVLFGVLGAGLSVAQGLLGAEVSAKIPAQRIGAFVVWMRPAIGAVAALLAYVILSAGFFSWEIDNTGVTLAVACAAGFSERFIVGAVERISA